jgi:hypothetical protein
MAEERIIFGVEFQTEQADKALLDMQERLRVVEEQARKSGQNLDKINDVLGEQSESVQKVIAKEETLKKIRQQEKDIDKVKKYNQELRNTQKELQNVSTQAQKSQKSLGELFKQGAAAFGGFAIGQSIAQSLTEGFRNVVQGEQLQTAFETIIGSSEKAKQTLASLTNFAKTTPFELPQVQKAAKQLLAFGFAAEELEPTLRKIGDVAAGVGVPIDELAQIFGKVKTQGKLTREELLLFLERGIDIQPALMRIIGVTSGEQFNKAVEQGKVTFRELSLAIDELTSAGGRFAGLMEKQSLTLGGQLSNLKDEFGAVLAEGLAPLMPVFKATVEILSVIVASFKVLIETITELPKYLNENKEIFAALGTAILTLDLAMAGSITKMTSYTLAVNILTKAKQAAIVAIRAFNAAIMANPLAILATAATVATIALLKYKQEIDSIIDTKEELKTLTDKSTTAIEQEAIAITTKEIKAITDLTEKVKNNNLSLEERKKALTELQNKYPQYFNNIDIEKLKIEDLDKAYKTLTDSILKTAMQRVATKKIVESVDKSLEALLKFKATVESDDFKLDTKNFGWFDEKTVLGAKQFGAFKASVEEVKKLNEEVFAVITKANVESRKMGAVSKETENQAKSLAQRIIQVTGGIERLAVSGKLERSSPVYQASIELNRNFSEMATLLNNINLFNAQYTESLQNTATATETVNENTQKLKATYEFTKQSIKDTSESLVDLNKSLKNNIANLEKELQNATSSKGIVEQLLLGADSDFKKTQERIQTELDQSLDKINKDYNDSVQALKKELDQLNKEKSTLTQQAFLQALKEIKDNEKQLDQQKKELEEKSRALATEAFASAARESYIKRTIALKELAQRTQEDIDKQTQEMIKERMQNINDILKNSLSLQDAGGIRTTFAILANNIAVEFNQNLDKINTQLKQSEQKIESLRQLLTNTSLPPEFLRQKEAELEAENKLYLQLNNERIKIEMQKSEALEKIKLEEMEKLSEIEVQAYRKQKENVQKQAQALQEIFYMAASSSTGSMQGDKIRASLFRIGENLFTILSMQSDAETDLFRKKEAEKLKIQSEFTKQRLELLQKEAEARGDTTTVARLQTEINSINTQVAGYNKLAQSIQQAVEKKQQGVLTEEEQKKKTAAYIQLAGEALQIGIEYMGAINATQTAQIQQSITRQQQMVEEARRSAEFGKAELLQENEKVLNELREQERAAAEERINLAMAEMAAKSLVAIATAAAQGGVAAAITIPIVIASMLAGFAIMKEQAKSQAAGIRGFKTGGYTGDYAPYQVAGLVHGKEFVFDADITQKNRDIFEKIHKGEINLREEIWKASLLEKLLFNKLDIKKNVASLLLQKPMPNDAMESVNERLERLEKAIKEQERLRISIDEKGIYAIASKIEYDKQRIRSLSK